MFKFFHRQKFHSYETSHNGDMEKKKIDREDKSHKQQCYLF